MAPPSETPVPWFPVVQGIVSLGEIPEVVDGQITVEHLVPVWNQVTTTSSKTRTIIEVKVYRYSLNLLTEIAPIPSHTELVVQSINTINPDIVLVQVAIADPTIESGSLAIDVPVTEVTINTSTVIHAGDVSVVYVDSIMNIDIQIPTISVTANLAPVVWHLDGVNNSTSTSSSGAYAVSATFYGTAALSTTRSKYGASSVYFSQEQIAFFEVPDPSISRLVFVPDIQLGSEDWCIEFWWFAASPDSTAYTTIYTIKNDAIYGELASLDVDFTDNRISQWWTGGIGFNLDESLNPLIFTRNQWNHVAWYRIGNSYYLALNGVVESDNVRGPVNPSDPILNIEDILHTVGEFDGLGYYTMPDDYVDEIRISYGTSPYTASNFIPPSSQF
jgi:hypothetical protein